MSTYRSTTPQHQPYHLPLPCTPTLDCTPPASTTHSPHLVQTPTYMLWTLSHLLPTPTPPFPPSCHTRGATDTSTRSRDRDATAFAQQPASNASDYHVPDVALLLMGMGNVAAESVQSPEAKFGPKTENRHLAQVSCPFSCS